MKKTLIAAGVLAAMAGSAVAGVTVYGRADLSMVYADNGTDKTFSMNNGTMTGSRLGFKGVEELGNGMKVGFVLENGFGADTGALGGATTSKLFDRQSTLFVSGDFGTVFAGRMAGIATDAGSLGFYAGTVGALGTGNANAGHSKIFANFSQYRWDNMVAYESPEMGGATVYAQYAMGDTKENTAAAMRYAALGTKVVLGSLQIAALVDQTNAASAGNDVDDPVTLNVGGNYDFGFMTFYVATQYAKNPIEFAGVAGVENGYGINFSAMVPTGEGADLKMNVGYSNADFKANDENLDSVRVSAAYTKALSKRTKVYTGFGYLDQNKDREDTYEVYAGMAHYF